MNTAISLSTVPAIPQEAIDDLHRRLDQVRWPQPAAGAAVPGFNVQRLRPLVEHWRHGFDWRRVEARLEALGQLCSTTGDGRRLHAVHARGGERVPVLLVHGWPDSPLRFLELIPLLTAAGHDVVAPAIPGFGLSEQPQGEMSRELVSQDFHALMTGLGYQRYAVHGGDFGSAIASCLAGLHPEAVVALHLTDVPFDLAYTIDEGSATEQEASYLRSIQTYAHGQMYLAANCAQPDVTALALADSPVGLLAWMAHLYDQWSESPVADDDLLASVSLMWLTGSVRSSMRLYSEPASAWDTSSEDASSWEASTQETTSGDASSWGSELAQDAAAGDAVSWGPSRVQTPTAFALFPADLGMAPRALADRHFAVERFTVMPRGGHFAALEQPALLAEDLTGFLVGRS